MNLWEFHAEEAWIFEKGFFMIRRESSQCLLDEEELIEFILPWKHGISIDELAHDAANSPNIDLLRVHSTN